MDDRYETTLDFPLLPPLISPLTPKLYYSITSSRPRQRPHPPDPKCFDRIFCLDCETRCPDTSASPQTCGSFPPALLSFTVSLHQPPPQFNLCLYQPRGLCTAHLCVCTHLNADTNMLSTLSLSSQPPLMITPSHFQTLSVSHSLLISPPHTPPGALEAPRMAFSDRRNKK